MTRFLEAVYLGGFTFRVADVRARAPLTIENHAQTMLFLGLECEHPVPLPDLQTISIRSPINDPSLSAKFAGRLESGCGESWRHRERRTPGPAAEVEFGLRVLLCCENSVFYPMFKAEV